MSMKASLRREIASLERQLTSRDSGRASRSGRRAGGRYMDEKDEAMMDEMGDELMMDDESNDELMMDDESNDELMMDEELMMDDELMMDEEIVASRRKASRRSPGRSTGRKASFRRRRSSEVESGIEDEINQDYLSEVVDVAPGSDGDADADLVIDVAPTQMARLKEASARLDRLANYVESEARRTRSARWMKVAAKIDSFADQIDNQIRKARRTK